MIVEDVIHNIQRRINAYQRRLSEEASRAGMYQNKVDALNSLYNRMKEKKEEMQSLKDSLDSFTQQTYEYWKGNVFDNRYQNKIMQELAIDGYGNAVDIIDDNLDEINSKKAYYQNLIYQSQGVIGDVKAVINTCRTDIQNLLN